MLVYLSMTANTATATMLVINLRRFCVSLSVKAFPFSTLAITDPSHHANCRPRIPVIRYEDDWVCVNKPAGLPVHRTGSSNRNEVTLRSMLKKQLARKVFPVHRLDHRTSGAILFAFDSDTCGIIHKRLANGTKDYVALLRGEWKYDNPSVMIHVPLASENGELKDASTEFKLVSSSNFRNMPCSLVTCHPTTGRTHQIRRHAYHLGHPILGDTEHGDSRVNRQWRTERGLTRMALHCLSIHLEGGADMPLIAPLSREFRTVLEQDENLWNEATDIDSRILLDDFDEIGGTFGRNFRKRQTQPQD